MRRQARDPTRDPRDRPLRLAQVPSTAARTEDTDDEPTLVTWLRLVGTRSADEIVAAIRAFRAS